MVTQEFLPLCDVLFNIISLASYFCDIVFDLVMGYALLQRQMLLWFSLTVGFVSLSLLVTQVVSLRWYMHTVAARSGESKPTGMKKLFRTGVIILHCCLFGVLWRYFKLFLPVDLRFVKYEVRDLCMLRLVHAFVQAAPVLLVQLYLLLDQSQVSDRELSDLNLVSVSLSLFSVCWALASFSKNVRMHNVHKLVLTWLGVIFQLLWRLGTVSSRVVCLVCYASVYKSWVLLVLLLHWVSMFLWLVSPNNLFQRERLSRPRKLTLCSLIAFVYVFAYVNLQESNHRPKMVIFYVVMFVENCLLMWVWWVTGYSQKVYLPWVTLALYLGGLFFMFLYYRYLHVRRLNYESGGRPISHDTKDAVPNGGCCISSSGSNGNNSLLAETNLDTTSNSQQQLQQYSKPATRYSFPICFRYYGGGSHNHGGIPGVFNCRFTNPYAMTKRKKKKPTSFVPPPSVGPSVPFWCRPISAQGDSERGTVDIRTKLEEKKQQQLAELRLIEEEMMRGKLASPPQYSPQILLAPHYLRACEESNGLPYTLPRQTQKYFRRTRLGRHLRPEHYLPPANSSDGDVDSGDDNDSECWYTSIPHLPFRLQQNRAVRHETKL